MLHLLCQHQCNFVVLPDLINFAIYICKKMCVTYISSRAVGATHGGRIMQFLGRQSTDYIS
jgi:hypothetical protein